MNALMGNSQGGKTWFALRAPRRRGAGMRKASAPSVTRRWRQPLRWEGGVSPGEAWPQGLVSLLLECVAAHMPSAFSLSSVCSPVK